MVKKEDTKTGTQVVAKTQCGDIRKYWPTLTRNVQYMNPLPPRVITDDGSEFHSPFAGADLGATGGERGDSEENPARPSRSAIRTALFRNEDLSKWNRGRSKVLEKELEASASGVAGD